MHELKRSEIYKIAAIAVLRAQTAVDAEMAEEICQVIDYLMTQRKFNMEMEDYAAQKAAEGAKNVGV